MIFLAILRVLEISVDLNPKILLYFHLGLAENRQLFGQCLSVHWLVEVLLLYRLEQTIPVSFFFLFFSFQFVLSGLVRISSY